MRLEGPRRPRRAEIRGARGANSGSSFVVAGCAQRWGSVPAGASQPIFSGALACRVRGRGAGRRHGRIRRPPAQRPTRARDRGHDALSGAPWLIARIATARGRLRNAAESVERQARADRVRHGLRQRLLHAATGQLVGPRAACWPSTFSPKCCTCSPNVPRKRTFKTSN